ncbi:RING finger and WD repeat domain-containing protein 3 [Polyrhizophydium stewartii]|uniref:RING-type E3 ubiquitin transferase n=1 Tax=Polyrhizophydium stewartii TaxID=2732419 RepID=A0ABR4MYV7_9FUNG
MHPISKRDMIPVFTKNVVTIDTMERDAAIIEATRCKKQLDILQKRNAELEKEIAQVYLLRDIYKRESEGALANLAKSKHEIETPVASDLAAPEFSASQPRPFSQESLRRSGFHLKSTINLSASDSRLAAFGVLMVNLRDTNHQQFIPVHKNTIRDCQSSQNSDCLLLTTALDRTLKLTSFKTGHTVQTFNLDAPGWSCCFDSRMPTTVFAGTVSNHILQFDTRRPGETLARFNFEFSMGKAVHSLRFATLPLLAELPRASTSQRDRQSATSAIVGATFDEIVVIPVTHTEDADQGAWAVFGEPIKMRASTPAEQRAACTALAFEQSTCAWAAAMRRGTQGMLHRVGRLEPRDSQASSDGGGSLQVSLSQHRDDGPLISIKAQRDMAAAPPQVNMTRIHLFTLPSSPPQGSTLNIGAGSSAHPQQHPEQLSLLLATWDQSSSGICIWDTMSQSSQPWIVLPLHEAGPVMDIKTARINGTHTLFALTEQRLFVFEYAP